MSEIVKFVSAKSYLNTQLPKGLFFCLSGRKEVVVLCSDELKETLRELPSEYLQPRLKDIKAYLDKQGIKHVTEDLKNTTQV
jgi:hypothetical protein